MEADCPVIDATATYPAAPTVSPAAHSACPHSQAMDRWLTATISQYSLQYLLSFAAVHSQPGCAHFSGFFSAMIHLRQGRSGKVCMPSQGSRPRYLPAPATVPLPGKNIHALIRNPGDRGGAEAEVLLGHLHGNPP